MLTKLILILSLGISSVTLAVNSQNSIPSNTKNKIELHLLSLFPDLKNIEITHTDIQDVYQFWAGTQLNYVQYKDGHIFLGELYNLERKVSLAREAEQKNIASLINRLNKNDLIRYPAQNEKHEISIFTDVDCHFCRKIHTEIPKLNAAGISVQYVAFPAYSRDINKHISVWCADNPLKAMNSAKKGFSIPEKNCKNSVRQTLNLGSSLGFNGTPNIVYATGETVEGYQSAEQIIAHLNQAKNKHP